jgi:hypothetical protein
MASPGGASRPSVGGSAHGSSLADDFTATVDSLKLQSAESLMAIQKYVPATSQDAWVRLYSSETWSGVINDSLTRPLSLQQCLINSGRSIGIAKALGQAFGAVRGIRLALETCLIGVEEGRARNVKELVINSLLADLGCNRCARAAIKQIAKECYKTLKEWSLDNNKGWLIRLQEEDALDALVIAGDSLINWIIPGGLEQAYDTELTVWDAVFCNLTDRRNAGLLAGLMTPDSFLQRIICNALEDGDTLKEALLKNRH